jgi:hypothetical protein
MVRGQPGREQALVYGLRQRYRRQYLRDYAERSSGCIAGRIRLNRFCTSTQKSLHRLPRPFDLGWRSEDLREGRLFFDPLSLFEHGMHSLMSFPQRLSLLLEGIGLRLQWMSNVTCLRII